MRGPWIIAWALPALLAAQPGRVVHAELSRPDIRIGEPVTLRVVVDHDGKDQTQSPEAKLLGKGKAVPGPSGFLQQKAAPLKAMVPKILTAAEGIAEKEAVVLREAAAKAMHEQLDAELARLEKLREMGHPVPESEIAALKVERDSLDEHLLQARLRVDSVRLVLAGVS